MKKSNTIPKNEVKQHPNEGGEDSTTRKRGRGKNSTTQSSGRKQEAKQHHPKGGRKEKQHHPKERIEEAPTSLQRTLLHVFHGFILQCFFCVFLFFFFKYRKFS